MIPYSCKFWIRIQEMPKTSLPQIIFNKWTFIDGSMCNTENLVLELYSHCEFLYSNPLELL
jgi:hypothetical protein